MLNCDLNMLELSLRLLRNELDHFKEDDKISPEYERGWKEGLWQYSNDLDAAALQMEEAYKTAKGYFVALDKKYYLVCDEVNERVQHVLKNVVDLFADKYATQMEMSLESLNDVYEFMNAFAWQNRREGDAAGILGVHNNIRERFLSLMEDSANDMEERIEQLKKQVTVVQMITNN